MSKVVEDIAAIRQSEIQRLRGILSKRIRV